MKQTVKRGKARVRTRAGGERPLRNCDVMVTPAALRKGWERRCDYGTPCCPFEYALEPFYGEDAK